MLFQKKRKVSLSSLYHVLKEFQILSLCVLCYTENFNFFSKEILPAYLVASETKTPIKEKAVFPQIWRKNACEKWCDTIFRCFKATERARNIKDNTHAVVLFFNITILKIYSE